MLLVILMVKKLLKNFKKKSCKKQSKEFRDMVNSCFYNIWIDKKDIVI